MFKKQYILIALIIIVAGSVAYFYLKDGYFNQGENNQDFKIYTASDFPDALERMDEETLQISLDDLNKQYQKLKEGDKYIYIRWINIGILKRRLGDYQGAEQAWQYAASYNPDQYLAFGNLADLYLFDLGQNEKAEEYYQKAIAMQPNNYNYYHGLAALYRYNMTEKANLIEGLMINGAENNPGEAVNYYMYLANYFAEDGNSLVKSKYYANRVLEIDPSLESQLPDNL